MILNQYFRNFQPLPEDILQPSTELRPHMNIVGCYYNNYLALGAVGVENTKGVKWNKVSFIYRTILYF